MGETNLRNIKIDQRLLRVNYSGHDEIYKTTSKNYKCGFSICDCDLFQKLASKKLFVLTQGFIMCLFGSSFAYYNATITTLEKRYDIPSRNVGLITTGFDLSTPIMTPILSFYLGNRHRPRWIAFSGFVMGLYCLVVAFLHVITGPGEYALSFIEDNVIQTMNSTNSNGNNTELCSSHTQIDYEKHSEKYEGNLFPQIYLFLAQFITGFVGSIHDSLGTAYMDDNILKSKVPLYISISQCIRLLGPSLGYLLASICLQFYIAPTYSPTIRPNDSKWLGAWWFGYVVIGFGLILFSFVMTLFPKELPRAAFRKQILQIKENKLSDKDILAVPIGKNDKNLSQLQKGLMKILTNKIFMFMVLSNAFNLFGTVPYTMYGAKYIETQFRQTASFSSLLAGPTTIICTTVGILGSGWVINKFKPESRSVAIWILFTACVSCVSFASFMYFGCAESDMATQATNQSLTLYKQNFEACDCDFVKYTPVCGDDRITYLSPCHAGCSSISFDTNQSLVYENCSLIKSHSKIASSGSCYVDCSSSLSIFIVILCFERLLTSSGRSSCFFLTVKSINKDYKEFGLAIGAAFISLLVYVPAPVIFGWIFDNNCLYWGQTYSGGGHCWLYNNEQARGLINFTSVTSIAIGIVFDMCTIWNIKGLALFDKDEEKLANELKILKKALIVNKSFENEK